MTPAEVYYRDEAVLYAGCGPVWVMLLIGAPTEERMRRAEPTLAAMARTYPDGFATLTWILPSAGVSMDGPSRQAATDATKRYAKQILTMANVVEGDGFWAATVRAVLSGLTLLGSIRTPQRTFASVADAVEWMAGKTPIEFPPTAELALEIDRLRPG